MVSDNDSLELKMKLFFCIPIMDAILGLPIRFGKLYIKLLFFYGKVKT